MEYDLFIAYVQFAFVAVETKAVLNYLSAR